MLGINPRLLAEVYGCLHLVVALQLTKFEVGLLLELSTTAACATSVDDDADETFLCQVFLQKGSRAVACIP